MTNTEDPKDKYHLRYITVPHCGNCKYYDEGEFPEDSGCCLNDLMRDDSRIAAFTRYDEVCDLYKENGEEDQEDDSAPRVSLKIAPCEMVEPQNERNVMSKEEGMQWLRNNGFGDLFPISGDKLFSAPFILDGKYMVISAWPFMTSDGEVSEWDVLLNGFVFSGDTPQEALDKAFKDQNCSFEDIKAEYMTKEVTEELKKVIRRPSDEGCCETCKYANREGYDHVLRCHNATVKKWHSTTDTIMWLVCGLYEPKEKQEG